VMSTHRIRIPHNIADRLMFESDRTCNLCTQSGLGVQIHHIDGNSANNDEQNLVVLCLNCHDEVSRGPGLARGVSSGYLIKAKSFWVDAVSKSRKQLTTDGVQGKPSIQHGEASSHSTELEYEGAMTEEEEELRATLLSMLVDLKASKAKAGAYIEAGTTVSYNIAFGGMIDDTILMLVRLSGFFPEDRFGANPEKFFRRWRRDVSGLYYKASYQDQPGTMHGYVSASKTLAFLEDVLMDFMETLGVGYEWYENMRTAFENQLKSDI
jgi:HNH endonuclease